jgi:hypothetical protein
LLLTNRLNKASHSDTKKHLPKKQAATFWHACWRR